MDRRERLNEPEETLRVALDGHQAKLWTSLPGIIQSFDAAAQTAVIQPAIQGVYLGSSGDEQYVTLPLLLDCPVQFPSGGGFTLTFPVAADDECLVVFASRCIDAWWQQGGIQPPAEYRMHDLSDGLALLGFPSQPNIISSISTASVQLRSNDGQAFVELQSGHVVNVTAPGGINLNGVTIDSSGNVAIPGTTTGTGEGTFNAIPVSTHTHVVPGITSGSSSTTSDPPA